jgi:hypothetical protein
MVDLLAQLVANTQGNQNIVVNDGSRGTNGSHGHNGNHAEGRHTHILHGITLGLLVERPLDHTCLNFWMNNKMQIRGSKDREEILPMLPKLNWSLNSVDPKN